MNKEDLKKASGITSNIIARMSKGNYVNLEPIEKICLDLDCKVKDIVKIYRNEV